MACLIKIDLSDHNTHSSTVAVVGLEMTFYEVPEGDMVEVCAIVYSPSVSCPIQFPFSVNLLTADGSAGM